MVEQVSTTKHSNSNTCEGGLGGQFYVTDTSFSTAYPKGCEESQEIGSFSKSKRLN